MTWTFKRPIKNLQQSPKASDRAKLPAKKKLVRNLEKEVQATILQYLKVAGYFAVRLPLGPVLGHRGAKVFWRKNPLAGFPDIFGICKNQRGRMFVIECKSTNGRVAAHQKIWLDLLAKHGVLTIVARDVNHVMEQLRLFDRPLRCPPDIDVPEVRDLGNY